MTITAPLPYGTLQFCRLTIRHERYCEVAVGDCSDDPIACALAAGTYRTPYPLELCLNLLRPGDRVLDIGAHIGTFSLQAAAIGCEVAAVEAFAENAALLRASVEHNRTSQGSFRVHVFECAAGDRADRRRFEGYGPYGGLAPAGAGAMDREVAVRRIDDIVDELGWDGVDLVKLDVEGGELLVLSGMGHVLAATPLILYESNAARLQRMGASPEALVRRLDEAGFRSYAIDTGSLRELEPPYVQYECLIDHLAVRGELPPGLPTVVPPRSIQQSIDAVVACSYVDHPAWLEHLVNTVLDSPAEIRNAPEVRATLIRLGRAPESSAEAVATARTPVEPHAGDTPARRALARHLRGRGLELGPGHEPFPLPRIGASIAYIDRWTPQESSQLFPELEHATFPRPDVIADLNKEKLGAIADASVDFVIASHILEHLADPIGMLGEIHRVLRTGGVAILLLPDRRTTFDRLRAPTPLKHLQAEHAAGVEEVSDDHIVEFVRATSVEGESPSPAEIDLHRRRSVHVHCWSETEFLPVVTHVVADLGQQWSFVDGLRTGEPGSVGIEFGYVLRKEDGTLSDDEAAERLEADWQAWYTGSEVRRGDAATTEADDLRSQIEALKASTSWRMTAPLRTASGWLRARWGHQGSPR
jgi:FkbM family methyltransferase